MISLKNEREREKMRRSGALVGAILRELRSRVVPGIELLELEHQAEQMISDGGARPAFKGYRGYPYCLCTSVNEEVVHGMPSKRQLQEGDIVGLDFGVVLDGFYGDSAITVPVGKISQRARTLVEVTEACLNQALHVAREGKTLKDIAHAVEAVVQPHGFGIVREYVGHGIGRRLHEDPQVANYVEGALSLPLMAGMTLAIEPMITSGNAAVTVLDDGWTVVTQDRSLAAHFEHTILITQGECEVLTKNT